MASHPNPPHPLYSRLTPQAVPARPARAPRTPAPPLRASPRALLAGLGAGAATVVILWLVQATPSLRLGALYATFAHLSGLLAGYGILVMLLLMARVPAIEHGVGADRLARWHALGGRHQVSFVDSPGFSRGRKRSSRGAGQEKTNRRRAIRRPPQGR